MAASRNLTKEEHSRFIESINKYAERSIDAYARAFNFAKDNSKTENLVKLKTAFRYGREANDDEIEKITSAVKNGEMPNPADVLGVG